MSRILAGLALAAGLTGAATAAVSVIGSGPERLCYESADSGRTAKSDLGHCSQALENGALPMRDRAATHTNRSVIYLNRGNAAAALADVDAALRISPELVAAFVNKAAALYLLDRFDEAKAAADKALSFAVSGEFPAAYFNRALVREALGDIKGAYADYQAALSLSPDFAPAKTELARFRVSKR